MDASKLAEVEVATVSTYFATFDVSNTSLLGTWHLSLTASGATNVFVTADTELDFSYRLYRQDNSTLTTLRPVENRPLAGQSNRS